MSFRFDFDVSVPAGDNVTNSVLHRTNEHVEKEPEPDKKQLDNNEDDTTEKCALTILHDVTSMLRERFQQPIQYDAVHLENNPEPLLRAQHASSYGFIQQDESDAKDENERIVEELEEKQTDILPGVYEGGLKVWECSIDLCEFLARQWNNNKDESSLILPQGGGGYVLELGCGHALPGCLVLRQELKRRYLSEEQEESSCDIPFCVVLAEYNEFVLRDVTLSNILLNTHNLRNDCGQDDEQALEMVAKNVVLAGGDWLELSRQLQSGSLTLQHEEIGQEQGKRRQPRLPPDGRFDLILAAETVYTSESAHDTAVLMGRHLALGTGVGLVATKRYYFGVGGGSDAFRNAANEQRIVISASSNRDDTSHENDAPVVYRLLVQTLQVYDNGFGNIRELLSVKCVKD